MCDPPYFIFQKVVPPTIPERSTGIVGQRAIPGVARKNIGVVAKISAVYSSL